MYRIHKMRNKRIVESFESFNKDNLEYLMLYKKAYVKNLERVEKSSKIFDEIKDYDISKFALVEKSYGFFMYPDEKFINLIKQLDDSVGDEMFFYITISYDKNNQIDFTEGIPEFLRGLSIAYKLYKLIIKRVGWITSDRYSSQQSYNLWYNLLQDKDLYCFTSNIMSGLIDKSISDNKLLEISKNIKKLSFDIELDDELKEKLKEIKC